MEKSKSNRYYYIKKDGNVKKVNKEEFDEFVKSLINDNKTYLCPNCSVCDCEKIRYTNIYECEEVNIGTYERRTRQYTKEGKILKSIDETFRVYDCDRFKLFKEIALANNNSLKDQILKIDKQLIILKDEIKDKNNENKNKSIEKLEKQRLEIINQIDNTDVLENLKKEEKELLKKKNQILSLKKTLS